MNEIEIKYSINESDFNKVKDFYSNRLGKKGESFFEINHIFKGGNLEHGQLLRVRELIYPNKVKYVLTYKDIATELEDGYRTRKETEITVEENPIELLNSLGFKESIVYEKERETFLLDSLDCTVSFQNSTPASISLDKLPFGYYIEVEGAKIDALSSFTVEKNSYPVLTVRHGKFENDIFEARFNY